MRPAEGVWQMQRGIHEGLLQQQLRPLSSSGRSSHACGWPHRHTCRHRGADTPGDM